MAAINVNKLNSNRQNSLPSKMGSRVVEVKPVGAWVRPEPFNYQSCDNAVVNAEIEEARVRKQMLEKEAKLRKFQEEVRIRVQKLQFIKSQQQLEKSYKAVEAERNIVKQSAFAAEKTTPRKNRCTMRTNEDECAIQSVQQCQSSSLGSLNSIEDSEIPKAFETQTNKVHKATSKARQNLTSRKVITAHFTEVPGGKWENTEPTKSSSSSLLSDADGREEVEIEDIISTDLRTAVEPKVYPASSDLYTDSADVYDSGIDVHPVMAKSSVTFNDMQPQIISSRSNYSDCRSSVPDIYPGVVNEEERAQARTQRAIYRRLFMDMEREQVKENLRRKEHHRKILQLKAEKEEERKRIELEAQRQLEASLCETSEQTIQESIQQEEDKVAQITKQSVANQRRVAKKNTETERYLEALRVSLREKIEMRNVKLPPLCCCGDTVWDTHPETCANNCYFYKNPKAYAKTLQSLLASCDVS